MDADELLARSLQEEEDRLSVAELMRAEAQQASSSNQQRNYFARRLDGGIRTVLEYETPTARAAALSVIPLKRLQTEADVLVERASRKASSTENQASDEVGDDSEEIHKRQRVPENISRLDAVLLRLLLWFKHEFFTWCDAPLCGSCGTPKPTPAGAGKPTDDELKHGANRVELFTCGNEGCKKEVRFPRYNDPVKLLSTKTGRCGEYANAFTLCCVSLGYEARWVLDWTDHVWTEVWSADQNKWLHCDSCENICDQPLLYEKGWGKKLSFVVAFGVHDVVDVTRRYIIDVPGNEQRRRAILGGEGDEMWLGETIASRRGASRSSLTDERQATLSARDVREQAELIACVSVNSMRGDNTSLHGRTTGSLAWRAARGELGELPVEGEEEKEAFKVFDPVAEAVRLEFTRLTTKEGTSPNEAAAKALGTVRRALRDDK